MVMSDSPDPPTKPTMSSGYKAFTLKFKNEAKSTSGKIKGDRAKVACERCKKRKSKCDGKKICGGCQATDSECVYKDREKRVNISHSSYASMQNKIESLENELSRLKKLDNKNEKIVSFNEIPEIKVKKESTVTTPFVADVTVEEEEADDGIDPEESHIFGTSSNIQLESEPADVVVKKLGEIQMLVFPKNKILNTGNMNSNSIFDQGKILRNLDIDQAIRLIEDMNFFLNSAYLAIHDSILIERVRSFYKRGFLQIPDSESSWRTLFYVVFAIGKQYNGDALSNPNDESNISILIRACLSELFDFSTNWDEIHVVTLTLLACLFRSYGADDKAVLFSDLSIDISVRIGLHVEPASGNNKDSNDIKKIMENEIKSRVWWSAYLTNRFLCAKLGHQFSSANPTRAYPKMILYNRQKKAIEPIEFPNAKDMSKLIELSTISDSILHDLYCRNTSKDASLNGRSYLKNVKKTLNRLEKWSSSLDDHLKLDFHDTKYQGTMRQRLLYSWHLNHCYNVHLITIPVLYALIEQKIKNSDKKFDGLSKTISSLVALCFDSSKLILKILTCCYQEMVLAIFGSMDTDYLFSCSISFLIGYYLELDHVESIKDSFDTCIELFKVIANRGNKNAQMKLNKILAIANSYSFNSSHSDSERADDESSEVGKSDICRPESQGVKNQENDLHQPNHHDSLAIGQQDPQFSFQQFSMMFPVKTATPTPILAPRQYTADDLDDANYLLNIRHDSIDFGSEESDFWEEAYASMLNKMDNGI